MEFKARRSRSLGFMSNLEFEAWKMVRKRKASQRSGLELKLRRAGSNPFF